MSKKCTLALYAQLQRGNLTQLAKDLKVSLPVVSSWVHARRKVPASRCLAIEHATNGLVRAETLRPDLRWTREERQAG